MANVQLSTRYLAYTLRNNPSPFGVCQPNRPTLPIPSQQTPSRRKRQPCKKHVVAPLQAIIVVFDRVMGPRRCYHTKLCSHCYWAFCSRGHPAPYPYPPSSFAACPSLPPNTHRLRTKPSNTESLPFPPTPVLCASRENHRRQRDENEKHRAGPGSDRPTNSERMRSGG